jgi:hypothetical protein
MNLPLFFAAQRHWPLLAMLSLSALAFPTHAGEGHDHGPAPAATGPALPRFAASSELFELVGVLEGKRLALYLDRSADNSPVTDAAIELEIGGTRHKATKHGSDEFEVLLPAEPKEGVLAVTATVTAGKETDLLAGELDIHKATAEPAPAGTKPWAAMAKFAAWAPAAATGTAVLLALLGLVWVSRRVMTSRARRAGGAA